MYMSHINRARQNQDKRLKGVFVCMKMYVYIYIYLFLYIHRYLYITYAVDPSHESIVFLARSFSAKRSGGSLVGWSLEIMIYYPRSFFP